MINWFRRRRPSAPLPPSVTAADIEDLADALGALPSELRAGCLEVVGDLPARTLLAQALAAFDSSIEQRKVLSGRKARAEVITSLQALAQSAGILESLAQAVQDQWDEISENSPSLRVLARVRLANKAD